MTGKGSHEARKKIMKAHLTSTEEGVFRDVVNSMVEGLCDKVDAWKTQAAEKVFKTSWRSIRHSMRAIWTKTKKRAKKNMPPSTIYGRLSASREKPSM
jgi:hypothetical protein